LGTQPAGDPVVGLRGREDLDAFGLIDAIHLDLPGDHVGSITNLEVFVARRFGEGRQRVFADLSQGLGCLVAHLGIFVAQLDDPILNLRLVVFGSVVGQERSGQGRDN
jgi:hypothetical protein